MIEIALYEAKDSVDVVRQPDGAVRVEVGPAHRSEHIADALSSHGLAELAPEAVSLFSDDNRARNFDHQGEFVLITAAQA